ncbi:6539_t:CDS:2, partial [Gigaspora rosea]
ILRTGELGKSETGNGTPNHAEVCCEAAQEWNKVKNKNNTEISNIIRNYLATPYNLYNIQMMQSRCSTPSEDLNPLSTPFIARSVSSAPEIPANAIAQKKAASEIGNDEKKLAEY